MDFEGEEVAVSAKGRKKGGRVTPKGTAARGGFSGDARRRLTAIFAQVLRDASDLPADAEALHAELWASDAWSVFDGLELSDHDALALFGGGMIEYAAQQRSAVARMVLRAFASVAPAPYGARAAVAAERMGGVADAGWAAALAGGVEVGEAWVWFDPVDDDGVSVLVGFARGGDNHTVGVYIDHNLGAMAKDAFVISRPPSEVLAHMREHDGSLEYRRIDPAEAAARWREALKSTDMTWEAPVSDDLPGLRALIEARLRILPDGGSASVRAEVDDEERERLLGDFLASAEVAKLVGSGRVDEDDVGFLAAYILTYALDYVEGATLRFSANMVEAFCCGWAPRKIGADEEVWAVLPEVLRAWIAFAGRRRGIPEVAIAEAVAAVDECEGEMLEAASDPRKWGPVKLLVDALLAQGVDLNDAAAVQGFIDGIKVEGGIGALV